MTSVAPTDEVVASSWPEDVAINKSLQLAIMERMQASPSIADVTCYSPVEQEVFARGMALLSRFDDGQMKAFAVNIWPSQSSAFFTTIDGVMYGRTACLIKADPLEIVAFHFLFGSFIKKYSLNAKGRLSYPIVLESCNSYRTIVRVYQHLPAPLTPRDFVVAFQWKRIRVGQYLLVAMPVDHALAPLDPRYVRAQSPRVILITELKKGTCRLEIVLTIDFKGSLPKRFVTNNILPIVMGVSTHKTNKLITTLLPRLH